MDIETMDIENMDIELKMLAEQGRVEIKCNNGVIVLFANGHWDFISDKHSRTIV